MIFSRWQAPVLPSMEQVKMIFEAEGLIAKEEICPARSKVQEHRHAFDEVRMVVQGEMVMKISGNQVLLRPGDRIEIPSNTKHETEVRGEGDCICICASRPFFGAI